MTNNETILVLDFGGHNNQLIARRIREIGVYSVIKPYTIPVEEIQSASYKGIILTGESNNSCNSDTLRYTRELLELGVPVLGICYGAQLIASICGGTFNESAC